ncbi:MAG: DEAD/DEAH box helicase [Chitinophagales bacterium]
MNLQQFLDRLTARGALAEALGREGGITEWKVLPARPARYGEWPEGIDPRLPQVLGKRGIHRLYCHQAEALRHALAGRNVVVVTPTASGKTLCYNLPVLQSVLADPSARSLYLFPTKALSQDQVSELHDLVTALGEDIKTFTYDGDTAPSARQAIRQAGHIVVTNPDMLHSGILPHHTKWVKLFENLKYVVIDEVHTYRGVFGSHLANLIRRLRRICRFYGTDPTFICCSATIANPRELAERLIGGPAELVDDNGAPAGERHIIFHNPPVVNKELGIRRSSLLEAKRWAAELLKNDISTIVFARSRVAVEVLLMYLQEAVGKREAGRIRGYRGGYLPLERRAIEQGLRNGSIRGVVATNALELGIDIGSLEAAVLVGYPGSIASTWQQAGRAGRRTGTSLAVFVASSNPLDQYLITHPDYFFGRAPEEAFVNPDNLPILISHLKCAAFELPFEDGETFGVETTAEVLEFLAENKVLHHVGGRWYWMQDSFPAEDISLRSAARENFVVIDLTRAESPRVIGEVDRFAAPMLIHEQAIYLHGGEQYQIERLDYENCKAYARRVDVDYYTDASLSVNLKVLDVAQEEELSPGAGAGEPTRRAWGEVQVNALTTMFKKIKLHTHENLGWGEIHLPEQEMHTTAFWLSFPPELEAEYRGDELQGALVGLANVLMSVAPLYLLSDPHDLHVACQVKSSFTRRPTIFLYDSVPGGVGLSEKLYASCRDLLASARQLIAGCGCTGGCPSCVGPAQEVGPGGKAAALRLLERC